MKLLTRCGIFIAVILMAVVMLSGCASDRSRVADPGAKLSGQTTSPGSTKRRAQSQEQLQTRVMNLADYIIVNLFVAGSDMFRTMEDRELQNRIYSIVYNNAVAGIAIATSSDPELAYLNMLVMVTLERITFERYWQPEVFGDVGLNYLATLRDIESEVWDEANELLTDEQQQVLKNLIADWLENHPDLRISAYVRFTDFTDAKHVKNQNDAMLAQGLLAEVSEATIAVDQARLLGERMMFLATRIPSLLGWKSELTVLHIAEFPETRQLLDDVKLISKAPDKMIKTIDTLRDDLIKNQEIILDRLSTERQAAIDQVMDRITKERMAIIQSFEQEEENLRSLLAETREALHAGEELAAEINLATQSIDALALRIGFNNEAEGEDEQTIHLQDIQNLTKDTTVAVQELTTLMLATNRVLESTAWDEREEEIDRFLTAIEQGGYHWIDTVFIRSIIFVLIFFAGLMAYRWASLRWLPADK